MLVDLHVKSAANEGVDVDTEAIIRRAKEYGLNAVAFTESSRTSHANELVQLGEKYGIQVYVGIEVSTDLGILICFPPKIDQFLLEEEWRQANELTIPAADYVIEMIEEIGGAVIASRPYDLEIPYNMGDWVFRINGIDAIEVFNPRVGQIQSDFAQEAAQALGIPTTGGSDPSDSVTNVGRYATFFASSFETQAEFVEALKGCEYWSILIGDVVQERSSRPKDDSSHHHRDSRDNKERFDRSKQQGRRPGGRPFNSSNNRPPRNNNNTSQPNRRRNSNGPQQPPRKPKYNN